MPVIGYVEYRKRCVKGNNGKCRDKESASNRQGLDTPSNRNCEYGKGHDEPVYACNVFGL